MLNTKIHLPINPALNTVKQTYTGIAEADLLDLLEINYFSDSKDLVIVNTIGELQYQIHNTLGQCMEQGVLDKEVTTKNVWHLPVGTYHIQLITPTKETCYDKFIVQ